MTNIEYRARVTVDDLAPLEAHEYAKQNLRMQILNDQDYQLETLKHISSLKIYIQSQITYQEKELKRWQNTPFLTRVITGDNVHHKIDTCHEVLINLKTVLAYTDHIEEALNYQIKRNTENRDPTLISHPLT